MTMPSYRRILFILYLLVDVFVQLQYASTQTSDITEPTSGVSLEGPDGENLTNQSDITTVSLTSSTEVTVDNPTEYCPDGVACSELSQDCLHCVYNMSCVYRQTDTMQCTVKEPVLCEGNRSFTREFQCRYCYQVEHWLYTCSTNNTCAVVTSPPRSAYLAICTVKSSVDCMGKRKFLKKLPCNWTNGYRWTTALALSITLGGLGADRFYLGLWRAGLGKLFSFGGLGVWTIVDVILIAIGYVGPSDGSLYMW